MLSHWYNASLEGQRCSAAMIKEPQYLPCSIPLIARIRPIKFETLSALPSVTNTSAQLSPPIYMWRLPSTKSSYSCLRCKSISSKCGQTLSYFHYFLYSAKPRILFADQRVILVGHRLALIPWLWNGINLPPKRSVLLQTTGVSNVPVYISKTGSFWA